MDSTLNSHFRTGERWQMNNRFYIDRETDFPHIHNPMSVWM